MYSKSMVDDLMENEYFVTMDEVETKGKLIKQINNGSLSSKKYEYNNETYIIIKDLSTGEIYNFDTEENVKKSISRFIPKEENEGENL